MKAIVLNLNPAYDVFVKTKTFEIGKETIGNIENIHSGGKGMNVMKALYEYGMLDSEIISFLFSDNSKEYKKELERFVYKSQYEMDGRIRENITVSDGKDETRLSFNGSIVDDGAIQYLESILSSKKRTVIIVSGSLPIGLDKKRFKKLLIDLKQNGNILIMDSRSFDVDDILEIRPNLIKPNEEELESVFKIDSGNEEKITDYFMTMTKNSDMLVMISRGSKESYLVGDNFRIKANVPHVSVNSTIGAGDSMIAGFASGLIKGFDKADSLKLAISFGSAKCLEAGANPPKKENIEKIFNEIDVTKI